MEITVSELNELVNSFGVDVKSSNDRPSITIPVSARENGKLYKPFSVSANEGRNRIQVNLNDNEYWFASFYVDVRHHWEKRK